MISYVKLWFLLKERGMKRTDLLEVISSATLAKLGKNEMVSLSVIEKICDYLDCQPGDILENVKEHPMAKWKCDKTRKNVQKDINYIENTLNNEY